MTDLEIVVKLIIEAQDEKKVNLGFFAMDNKLPVWKVCKIASELEYRGGPLVHDEETQTLIWDP
jgi:hypothetical protein